MNQNQFYEKLDVYFKKMDEHKQPISFMVSSEQDGVWYHFNKHDDTLPFHTFGISKLFMVAVVDQLIKQNKLNLDSPIHTYIDKALLKNLFVFRDIDYKEEITIRHLLEHTSGIADYFEGYNHMNEQIIDIMQKKPEHLFHPMYLLDFTRQHQTALATPGQRFYYADTGYVLLGIIVESVTNQTYQEALEAYVTTPLNLKQTYMNPYDSSIKTDQVIYNKKNISHFKSLSCHWGGSGIISTHEDLHIFMRAIFKKGFIDLSIKDQMVCCQHAFSKGINYGLGIMELRLDNLPFLLRTQKLPELYGHMSFYGTHAWYDPNQDLVMTMNYGNNKQYEKSFKVLAKTIKTYLNTD